MAVGGRGRDGDIGGGGRGGGGGSSSGGGRGGGGRSFGEVMRDIGRALGIGGGGGGRTGPGANRGGLGSLMSGPSTGSLGLPFGNAPSQPSVVGGGDREGRGDRDGPSTPTTPVVAPPTPPVTPEIPPITPAPEVPQAPTKVNPSDMTSTGPSEDLALESAEQGLASTILTSGQGIVEEEPGLLRDPRRLGMLARRRSLTGGGLIQ